MIELTDEFVERVKSDAEFRQKFSDMVIEKDGKRIAFLCVHPQWHLFFSGIDHDNVGTKDRSFKYKTIEEHLKEYREKRENITEKEIFVNDITMMISFNEFELLEELVNRGILTFLHLPKKYSPAYKKSIEQITKNRNNFISSKSSRDYSGFYTARVADRILYLLEKLDIDTVYIFGGYAASCLANAYSTLADRFFALKEAKVLKTDWPEIRIIAGASLFKPKQIKEMVGEDFENRVILTEDYEKEFRKFNYPLINVKLDRDEVGKILTYKELRGLFKTNLTSKSEKVLEKVQA